MEQYKSCLDSMSIAKNCIEWVEKTILDFEQNRNTTEK